MDPLRNPYTPNAGAQPPAILGRNDELDRFAVLLARMRQGRTEQSMIVTGLRGVGKTVLLGRFYKLALDQDWVVIDEEISKHDDDAFRRNIAGWMRAALFSLSPKARWTDRVRRAAGVLKSFTLSVEVDGTLSAGLDADPAEGFADRGSLSYDLTDLFVAVGEAAQSSDKGLVLLLDEIQFLSKAQLEALISALHKTVQRALPITLVGAGLPQIAELAGDAKSYAERLFVFPSIGHLSDPDARTALTEPAEAEGVTWTSDALDIAGQITDGYPYFLQELGYAAWNRSQTNTITADDIRDALPEYQTKLDSSFFRVRLDRTTDMQRIYLRAMADLGPQAQKAANVAARMGRTSPQMAPTRAELINMGLLYTPEHGYAAFTVPHFDQFMKRAMPTLVVPPVRSQRRRG